MRAKRPDRDHPSAPFLQSVELEEDRVEDWGSYPFHLPFLKGLRIELAPLTFLIGENGSGKTTLIGTSRRAAAPTPLTSATTAVKP